jgi:hypothetical protein
MQRAAQAGRTLRPTALSHLLCVLAEWPPLAVVAVRCEKGCALARVLPRAVRLWQDLRLLTRATRPSHCLCTRRRCCARVFEHARRHCLLLPVPSFSYTHCAALC